MIYQISFCKLKRTVSIKRTVCNNLTLNGPGFLVDQEAGGGVESRRPWNANFSKNFFYNPNFFFRQSILNTKKRIYIEVWYSLVRPAEDGKLPNTARLDSTPPGPFYG